MWGTGIIAHFSPHCFFDEFSSACLLFFWGASRLQHIGYSELSMGSVVWDWMEAWRHRRLRIRQAGRARRVVIIWCLAGHPLTPFDRFPEKNGTMTKNVIRKRFVVGFLLFFFVLMVRTQKPTPSLVSRAPFLALFSKLRHLLPRMLFRKGLFFSPTKSGHDDPGIRLSWL